MYPRKKFPKINDMNSNPIIKTKIPESTAVLVLRKMVERKKAKRTMDHPNSRYVRKIY